MNRATMGKRRDFVQPSRAASPEGMIVQPPAASVYIPRTELVASQSPTAEPEFGEGFEAFSQSYAWPIDTDLTVYTTSKRWRAIDVYVNQISPQPALSAFSVFVYAILPGGMRTLVASGRLGHFSGAPTATPLLPLWIASARAVASRYEVVLRYSSASGGGVNGEQIGITVIAADEAVEAPPFLGAIPLSVVHTTALSTTDLSLPELLAVSGSKGEAVASPRFIHVLEGSAAAAGRAPVFSFPLGDEAAAGGGGFAEFGMQYRSLSGFLRVVPSSTVAVCTPVADCYVQALVR